MIRSVRRGSRVGEDSQAKIRQAGVPFVVDQNIGASEIPVYDLK